MENSRIFFAFLASWCISVIAAHVYGWRKRLHWSVVTISHLAPTTIAILMVSIFLIGGGSTTAQFVAGSEAGKNLWTLWFNLWPYLLLLTAASAFIHLVLTIIAGVRKKQRKWIPVTLAALLMSAFAFFTVAANFPDA